MVSVVKIGGSLAYDERLTDWLDQILKHTHKPIVIVPGGGPFADQVRQLQSKWQFSDLAAHQMAILAMHQFGHLLTDLRPKIAVATSVQSIRDKLQQGVSKLVWIPDIAELNKAKIPATWEITSDSLAAWLSQQLNADHLFLIKSVELSNNQPVDNIDDQSSNIVDKAFAQMSAHCTCPIIFLGKKQTQKFHAAFDKESKKQYR